MDDLISRQAAIEEIKRCESADSYDYNNGLIRAMNAIADIPSAQPRTKCIAEIKISKEDLDELVAEKVEEIKAAQSEIIRCKDCKKRVYCRTSSVWAVAPSDNWYCADAKRREDG